MAPPRTIPLKKRRRPLTADDKCSGEGSEFLKFEDDALWPWSHIDGLTELWSEALAAIDARRDALPLIAILESDTPMTRTARRHVADMLRRHQLKRKPGGQATPAYAVSRQDAKMVLARKYVQAGATVEQAAARYRLDIRAVRDAVASERGSTRRAMRKLKAALE